jgi:hypothetical protein
MKNHLRFFSKNSVKLVLILMIVFTIFACSEKASSDLCEQKDVTYTNTIQPILEANCYECHNHTTKSGYISWEDTVKVRELALNGKLFGVINHETGFKQMPKGRAKLDTCDIVYIKQWVDAGALLH